MNLLVIKSRKHDLKVTTKNSDELKHDLDEELNAFSGLCPQEPTKFLEFIHLNPPQLSSLDT